MHEFGITQEILTTVVNTSARAGATKVNKVRITVGELTEVVPDSLQFAWEALTPCTIAEGAVLEVTQTPARSVCTECSTEFGHDRFDRRCTECGSFMTRVLSGDELRIDDMDVDAPEADTDPGEG